MLKIILIFGFLLLTTGVSLRKRSEEASVNDASVNDETKVNDEADNKEEADVEDQGAVKNEAVLEDKDNVEDVPDTDSSRGKFSFYSSNYKNDNGTESGEETAVSGDTKDGEVDRSSVEVSHKTLQDGEMTADTEADTQKALDAMAESEKAMENVFNELKDATKEFSEMLGGMNGAFF